MRFFFLMIRRPPRSTLFSLHDALPIWRPRIVLQHQETPGLVAHDVGAADMRIGAERHAPSLHLRPEGGVAQHALGGDHAVDRKSTRLNSSHANISYAVFCLKKKKNTAP